MRCNNCDALVPQAPSKEKMTLDDIKFFVQESIKNNKNWEHIRILGGEPTLHKQLSEILQELIYYKKNYSPDTRIQLVTNGYGKAVQRILERIPKEIEIENSQKQSNVQPTFSPINLAPIDDEKQKDNDFSKGCWIPSLCGITLDMHGYYPCSAAAAFDRVFGFDLGEKKIPYKSGILEEKFKKFCQYCGHFNDPINNYAENDIVTKDDIENFEKIQQEHFEKAQSIYNITDNPLSPTWREKLAQYKSKRPKLKKYNDKI